MNKCLYTKKKKNTLGITPYNSVLFRNNYQSRYQVFVGTPTTGIVRMEWAMARFGQIIPCNWGYKAGMTWIPGAAPIDYLVADAQNLIVKTFMNENAEWLLLIEHDNLLPADCFLRFNDYIRNKQVPIVSGLYFTKSSPAEPMVYRGRGNSYYTDWKLGDKVWVDAVPTGCLLIHRSIIEVLWNESPEYKAGDQLTRRVFYTPQSSWYDPQKGQNNDVGTSDMELCSRIMVDKIFEKAGWPKYQKMKFPFLVDTNIKVGHIDNNGVNFPSQREWEFWAKDPKKRRII